MILYLHYLHFYIHRYLCGEEDEESGEGQGQEEDTEKIAWWRSKLACLQENDDN